MICPRCGNEWDANKSPCTRCGLVIRLPNQPGSLGRTSTPLSNQKGTTPSGNLLPGMPQASGLPSGPLSNTPFPKTASSESASSRASMAEPGTVQPFPPSPFPNTPRPFNFTATSVPDTPPISATLPADAGVEDSALNRTKPKSEPPTGQAAPQAGPSHLDTLSSGKVPSRPEVPPQAHRFTDSLAQDVYRSQSHLRPSRLVTDQMAKDGQRGQTQQQTADPSQSAEPTSSTGIRLLPPGTLLHNGRYRLQELQGGQEWLPGVHEAVWIAQDAQRAGSRVVVCEVMLPTNNLIMMQSTLRAATIALTSVGRHPRIPTLWDAFSDRGRSFFVFELVEGESLSSRVRRTRRTLQEQDVVECCLQMTEVLELLAQQSPPLVHGLIRPEHIIVRRFGSQYDLTNFSLVLAGGATQYVAGVDPSRLLPYTAPEFVRGVIDVRSDLYSLMATAYHVVTGSAPVGRNATIPPAQRLNPNVSSQLDAILARGLSSIPGQRYQHPSELRQDLLAMRSVSSTLVPGSMQRPSTAEPVPQPIEDSVAQALKSLAVTENVEKSKNLLPAPEELPSMPESNHMLNAAIWLGVILLSLVVLVILARGFW